MSANQSQWAERPAPAPWRARIFSRLLAAPLLALAAGCALVACGPASVEPAPAGPQTASPATSASPSPEATASAKEAAGQLTIVILNGATTTSTWQLSCQPDGGTHPDPPAACRALQQHGSTALPAVSRGKMCSQVYGGSSSARVTGTWQGKPVDSRLDLKNGCEIARWEALAGLLPLSSIDR